MVVAAELEESEVRIPPAADELWPLVDELPTFSEEGVSVETGKPGGGP